MKISSTSVFNICYRYYFIKDSFEERSWRKSKCTTYGLTFTNYLITSTCHPENSLNATSRCLLWSVVKLDTRFKFRTPSRISSSITDSVRAQLPSASLLSNARSEYFFENGAWQCRFQDYS